MAVRENGYTLARDDGAAWCVVVVMPSPDVAGGWACPDRRRAARKDQPPSDQYRCPLRPVSPRHDPPPSGSLNPLLGVRLAEESQRDYRSGAARSALHMPQDTGVTRKRSFSAACR